MTRRCARVVEVPNLSACSHELLVFAVNHACQLSALLADHGRPRGRDRARGSERGRCRRACGAVPAESVSTLAPNYTSTSPPR